MRVRTHEPRFPRSKVQSGIDQRKQPHKNFRAELLRLAKKPRNSIIPKGKKPIKSFAYNYHHLAHNCIAGQKMTQREKPPCAAQVALSTVPRSPQPAPGPRPASQKYPTPPPLFPQPMEKKRIKSKKSISTSRNKALTTCQMLPAGLRSASAHPIFRARTIRRHRHPARHRRPRAANADRA